MFGKIFKFGTKKFVGIDIGTSSIRAVEISGRGQNRRLENYGEISNLLFQERPFRVFDKDTLLLSDSDIADAIQLIYQETGVQTREAVFSIPDFCSFFTSFELPTMSKEEIEEAVRYEVRSYVPLPVSEITLDWIITSGEVSKTPLKILVVAILNDVIEQYQNIARFSRLNLKVLEPEVFAMARSTIKKEDGNKIINLVDMGARSTTSNILEKGVLKMSHSFNVGGSELTQVLAKALNIDYNKAEALKRKYGLAAVTEDPEAKQNVREILLPLVDSIVEEIKKTWRDFYKNEGKEIEKVIISGGLTLLPNLKEYFSEEFKKEIQIADPFLGIQYPPVLEPVLKKRGPSYSVAVGLALKGFE